MIFCNKCFCDSELRQIIEGLGQIGACPICGNTNAYIYDTDKNFEIVGYFDELINIYTPAQSLPAEFPKAERQLLKDELLTNWNIFNNLSAGNVYNIITSICSEKYQQIPELFDNTVGIAELYNPDCLNKHSLLKTNSWEDFVQALKTQNRFHTNHINLPILERFCSYIRKPYKKGAIFYRGRISSSAGLCAEEMGPPLHDKASDGRANSLGIRCLYLANDNDEMGKALCRNDSPLDYVPTQYISDFIKSIEHNGLPEYAGLEYNSTMNPGGFNLAIFNVDLFKCIDVKTYMIEKLDYRKTAPI